MAWSDGLANEGYTMPAAVCLAHGRFVPCRKQGPHQNSSLPADVEKVRYFQHMSAREARQVPAPFEYEEDPTPWQDQFVTVVDQYGGQNLGCGGHVLEMMHCNGDPVAPVLRACQAAFTGWTPRMLNGEMEAHYTTVRHYRVKITGRKRNAEPGTSGNSAQ